MRDRVVFFQNLVFGLCCDRPNIDSLITFCIVSLDGEDYIVGYTNHANHVTVLTIDYHTVYKKSLLLNIVYKIPKFKHISANKINFFYDKLDYCAYYVTKSTDYNNTWVSFGRLKGLITDTYNGFNDGNKEIIKQSFTIECDNMFDVYNKLYADSSCEENNDQDTKLDKDLLTAIMVNGKPTNFDLNCLSDNGDKDATSNFKGCINNSTDFNNIHSSNDLLSNDDVTKLADIIAKERNSQWGDTYKRIAPIAKEVLGLDMTTQQFCGLMMLMKLMRWKASDFKSKDCLVDIINYAKLADN